MIVGVKDIWLVCRSVVCCVDIGKYEWAAYCFIVDALLGSQICYFRCVSLCVGFVSEYGQ